MEFRVKALDREQAVLAQQVDAIDESDARRQLGLLGLRVISLTPVRQARLFTRAAKVPLVDLQPGIGGAAGCRPVAGRIDRGAHRERGECRGAPASRANFGPIVRRTDPGRCTRRASIDFPFFVRRNGARERAHRIVARGADPLHHLSTADRFLAQDSGQRLHLSGGAAGRRHCW